MQSDGRALIETLWYDAAARDLLGSLYLLWRIRSVKSVTLIFRSDNLLTHHQCSLGFSSTSDGACTWIRTLRSAVDHLSLRNQLVPTSQPTIPTLKRQFSGIQRRRELYDRIRVSHYAGSVC
jgi:hypothetical protein